MPRIPERLRKLKGKSLDELRVRCTQAARARLERVGLSRETREPSDRAFTHLLDSPGVTGKLADADQLLQSFRQHELPLGRVFPGLADPTRTAREFRSRCPQAASATIAAAERIVAGLVDLGGRVVSLGARPDWTLEPVCGKRAPAIHWSRIAFLEPCVAGDCKFIWELNRHQYFITLGRAYAITGDDRYASLITDHLGSWMEDNPPKCGINWSSSLELAFRAIAWIWALSLVRQSSRVTGRLYVRALKYLYLHARHIEGNLSTYFSPNTHLTGEALGLLYIGTAFPEFRRAGRWRALGRKILLEQLDRQVFGDGVYFEQSTYYHRYTTDFYLHALLLTDSAESRQHDVIRAKVEPLLDYVLSMTRPNGTSPLIGDDDGGRLVTLGERASNDFRDTLALGAALLQRGDCAYVAGQAVEELYWLLGPTGVAAYQNLNAAPPERCSRAFPDSGYYAMRESWDVNADWAVVRCGPHASQAGAHAHADALALELSVGGHPTLIDPGTYVYTASRADRDYFRSSAAHNTVTIDGLSSAEPAESPFKWKTVPRSRATAWVSNATLDFFQGEHDGYVRLEAPAVHSRTVLFLKGEYWVICDRIRSDGKHRLALHWHWAPDIALSSSDGTVAAHVDGSDRPHVNARVFSRAGRLSCVQGWVSTAYGTRTTAPISLLDVESEATEELVTLIAKSTAGVHLDNCLWHAGSLNDSGVLTVAQASTVDTILTGPTSHAADPRDGVISDAACTWVRRSLNGELLAFALINGRKLVIDNRTEFQADASVDCAVGHDGPDGWRVDVQSADWHAPISTHGRIEESCAAFAE
jgi:uncharacterized heparinase superfamily protein